MIQPNNPTQNNLKKVLLKVFLRLFGVVTSHLCLFVLVGGVSFVSFRFHVSFGGGFADIDTNETPPNDTKERNDTNPPRKQTPPNQRVLFKGGVVFAFYVDVCLLGFYLSLFRLFKVLMSCVYYVVGCRCFSFFVLLGFVGLCRNMSLV